MWSDEPDALDAMLAEYESLREESLASLTHRMTVMNFTFGGLAVLIAGLLTRKVSDALAGVVAVLFVPQVGKAALLIWLGEYARSRRAGRWLRSLERKINAHTKADAMGWETSLANSVDQPTQHMVYPYAAVVGLILGATYTASVLGIYLITTWLRTSQGDHRAALAAGAVSGAVVLVEGMFLLFFLKRWSACRAPD